jgi:hypothetical protein
MPNNVGLYILVIIGVEGGNMFPMVYALLSECRSFGSFKCSVDWYRTVFGIEVDLFPVTISVLIAGSLIKATTSNFCV